MRKKQTTYADIIRKHRRLLGLTQIEVATALGLSSPQFISNFERGISNVPIKYIRRLHKILKLSPEFSFDDIRDIYILEYTQNWEQTFKENS